MAADPAHTFHLGYALSQMTQRRVLREEYPDGKPGGAQQQANILLRWWQEGRRTTRDEFFQRYTAFKDALATAEPMIGHYYPLKHTVITYTSLGKRIVAFENRELTESGQAYQRLEAMGLDILPLIMEHGATECGECGPAATR